MRWSKIKNIIILLLVMLNGFLFAQVGIREWKSRRGEQETRERMVAILARNGVTYLPEEVPGALEPVGRRVTLIPMGETQAALLVGELSDVRSQGTQSIYTGAEGMLTCASTGETSVEFAPAAALSEGAILDRLSKLGVSLQRAGAEAERENGIAYIQLYDGVPIPGETALLTLNPEPDTLTLRCLLGEDELLPAEDTVTAATALTRFLDELNRGEGYVCSQITDMYAGYIQSGVGTVTLTPAWFIETDTWQFAINGYTGAVEAWE